MNNSNIKIDDKIEVKKVSDTKEKLRKLTELNFDIIKKDEESITYKIGRFIVTKLNSDISEEGEENK